jgi:hypothetical protein
METRNRLWGGLLALGAAALPAGAQIQVTSQTAPIAVAEDFEGYADGEVVGILTVPGARVAEDCVGQTTTEQPSGFELTTGSPSNPPTLATPPAQDGLYVTHSIPNQNNTLAGLAGGLTLDDIGEGAITIRYEQAQQVLGLRLYGSAAGGQATLRCFDSSGALVGQALIPSSPDRDLTVTSFGAAIRVLTFTNTDPLGLALDDLRHQVPGASPFCFGVGGTPCPCGNAGDPGHGCRNGSFSSGAALAPAGTNGLLVTHGTPGQFVLFIRGSAAINGGNGVVFGDGLRCVGGQVTRLSLVTMGPAGDALLPSLPAPPFPATWYYQGWYRDPQLSPCGSGFNLTNGLAIP